MTNMYSVLHCVLIEKVKKIIILHIILSRYYTSLLSETFIFQMITTGKRKTQNACALEQGCQTSPFPENISGFFFGYFFNG